MFTASLARVESAFAKLTGRKRERPAQDTATVPVSSPVPVPEEHLRTPAAAALGSPGSAFDRVTVDWAAARAVEAQSSGGASDDAADDAHLAKRHRAMVSSAQERLQQAELEAREMRRKVP